MYISIANMYYIRIYWAWEMKWLKIDKYLLAIYCMNQILSAELT